MADNNPLKRSLDGAHDDVFPAAAPPPCALTPPTIDTPETQKILAPHVMQREPSPALSTSTLSSLPASAVGSSTGQLPTSTTPGGPPKKKRKLTAEERVQKEKEREERRIKKAAEDAAKEEVRRARQEKRKQEAELKEEKQRAKDLAKKEEEEKAAKKQRAQLRLGSFFAKATPTKPLTSSPIKAPDDSPSVQHDNSLAAPDSPSLSRDRQAAIRLQHHDYHKYFLPFALPANAVLAPSHDSTGQQFPLRYDVSTSMSSDARPASVKSLLGLSAPKPRGRRPVRAIHVIERLQGSHSQPIDLTVDAGKQTSAAAQFGDIDIKHIHFGEDVRPPYVGSYTKPISPTKASRAARNPLFPVREDTNYDYDSEAEWEEPEEGEDVDSDGEEDAESVGSADEMDGFVDDGDAEEQMKARRRLVTAESDPISSGICWEDYSSGRRQHQTTCTDFDLASMRLEWLLDTSASSIDPLCDSYWQPKVVAPAPAPTVPVVAQTDLFGRPVNTPATAVKSDMKPPRAPLQPAASVNAKVIVNAKSGEKGPIMAIAVPKAPKAPAQSLKGAAFDEFKDAVDGSNLTKVELLKALKQRFPHITNATISETLNSNFARHGTTNADKRWKLVSA